MKYPGISVEELVLTPRVLVTVALPTFLVYPLFPYMLSSETKNVKDSREMSQGKVDLVFQQ